MKTANEFDQKLKGLSLERKAEAFFTSCKNPTVRQIELLLKVHERDLRHKICEEVLSYDEEDLITDKIINCKV